MTTTTRKMLAGVSIATLTTCLFKRGFRNLVLQDVHLINQAAPRMIGPAFTLRYIPAREDVDVLAAYADREHPQRKAIETCPAGAVLVIDSRRDARAASAGDILINRLMTRGCAGIVTDGGFRDTPAIAALAFPAYHHRASAPTGPILHHAADLEVPIGCADVPVYPGDVMVGDAEAVIVIPRAVVEDVAAEAVEMTAYEDFALEKVRAGRSIFGLYPADDEARAEYLRWRQSCRGSSSP